MEIGNTQWYSTKDIAEKLNISRQAAARLIRDYKDNLEGNFFEKHGRGGRGGVTFWVNKEGVFKLANLKGYSPAGLDNTMLTNQKQKVVEKAMQPIPDELLNDPIIAVRLKQLEMERRVNSVEQKVNTLLIDRTEAKEQLELLPAPSVEAPPMSNRSKLIQLVAVVQRKTGLTHPEVWNQLYTQVYYRMGVNVNKRAKTAGVSKIDILERDSLLEPAYAIAKEIFRT